MIKSLQGPTIEPVTLDEIKHYLRVDHSHDDDHLTALIIAARVQIEQEIERALISQKVTLTFPLDPMPNSGTIQGLYPYRILPGRIAFRVPYPPLIRIEQIQGIQENQKAIDIPTDKISVNINRDPGVVVMTSPWYPHIAVTFIAGYGENREDVPENLKLALKKRIALHYDPEAYGKNMHAEIQRLLAPYKRRGI